MYFRSKRKRWQPCGAVDERHVGIEIRLLHEIRTERTNQVRRWVSDIRQIRDLVVN